jgi:CRISPR-associated protein Cas1
MKKLLNTLYVTMPEAYLSLDGENVVVRKDDEGASAALARNMIIGKLYNSRWILERAVRDHALRVDAEKIKRASGFIADSIKKLRDTDTLESVRGIEGEAAARYFSVFDELILSEKEDFFFKTRNRRPPTDRVNALLSLAYVLLASETASALSAVGLDPFVGFLHRDRPGRRSLALDLMEELRAAFARRFGRVSAVYVEVMVERRGSRNASVSDI